MTYVPYVHRACDDVGHVGEACDVMCVMGWLSENDPPAEHDVCVWPHTVFHHFWLSKMGLFGSYICDLC